MPAGSGTTDPHVAFSGQSALVQAPGSDYAPNQRDVGEHAGDRRRPLQRRAPAVPALARGRGQRDFDQATITANGSAAWVNATATVGAEPSNLDHIDKEWRFQDVPLSGHFAGHSLVVGWQLASDPRVELGGWALDDVCVVANPDSICGDGVKTATEQCDSGPGNADAPDACRTDCTAPACGDGIVDTGEDCDDGPANGRSACSTECHLQTIGQVGGGCDAGPSGAGGWLLALAVAGLLVRRRA